MNAVNALAVRGIEHLIAHLQVLFIPSYRIGVTERVVHRRVQMPDLLDHSGVASRCHLSPSVHVGRWIRTGSSAPEIEHATPTILGHVLHYLSAAISVAVNMAAGTRNLIAQTRFYDNVCSQLIKQDNTLHIETGQERLLGIDDLHALDVEPPRTIRLVQAAKEV